MSASQILTRTSRRPIILLGLLAAFIVSGCSDGSDSGFSAPADNDNLPGCADTDSCVPNPPLQIGGDRPAQVLIPSDYTPTTRYPLVIMLHGFGANGNVYLTYFGLEERVDPKQYILIAPDGTQNTGGMRFWNASPAACCAFSDEDKLVDDVAYIRGLIEEAAATYSIDTRRVGLIGHSNGGFMALHLACEASDLVTSLVSVAGSTYEDASSCAPASYPVNVLAMHGDEDETIFYQGGTIKDVDGDVGYPSAADTISRFASLTGCDTSNPLNPPNLDLLESVEGAETTVLAYPECDDDTEIELWSMIGGPHTPFPWTEFALDSMIDWVADHPRAK